MRANDTHIHTLRIRGNERHSNAISRKLQCAQWPEAKDQSWVFIRKIEVKAQPHQLDKKVLQQTQQMIDADNDASNIKRFSNLTELLAALCIDLADGKAAGAWYWNQWKHLFDQPKSQALNSLLSEHVKQLHSVCLLLHQQNALEKLFQALQTEQAQQLVQQWGWQHDISLSFLVTNNSPPQPSDILKWPLPLRSVQRWKAILSAYQKRDPRYILGLLLLAQESIPLALKHSPEQALAWVQQQLIDTESVQTNKVPTSSILESKSDAQATEQNATKHNLTSKHPTQNANIDNRLDSTAYTLTSDSKLVSTKNSQNDATANTPKPNSERITGKPANKGSLQHDVAEQDKIKPIPSGKAQNVAIVKTEHPLHSIQILDNSPKDFDVFYSHQAGTLYLLNFLNRNPVQAIMSDFWDSLPNGWGWLYQLAKELGLNENDPVCDYIAQRLGLDNTQQLRHLPPLPQRDSILKLALSWYQTPDISIWNPSLLTLPATIHYSPTHVDLYTEISNVKLDIRLAGLDINPGWLPWLGQVVHFHYETAPV